jgi:hypothetical protein
MAAVECLVCHGVGDVWLAAQKRWTRCPAPDCSNGWVQVPDPK